MSIAINKIYSYTHIRAVNKKGKDMEQIVYSPKSLGMAIQRQRRAKKLNQEEVGKPFKLVQSTISTVEQGFPGTQISTLFRVLAALDLEMVIRSKKSAMLKNDGDW